MTIRSVFLLVVVCCLIATPTKGQMYLDNVNGPVYCAVGHIYEQKDSYDIISVANMDVDNQTLSVARIMLFLILDADTSCYIANLELNKLQVMSVKFDNKFLAKSIKIICGKRFRPECSPHKLVGYDRVYVDLLRRE